MAEPNVNVSIKANVGDFLRGLFSAEAAAKGFKKSLNDLRTPLATTKVQVRTLTNELQKQSRAVRALTFQYGALRRTLLTFAVRTAIVSFTALVASMNSAVMTAGVLATSLANLGGAMGVGFVGGLTAATQGMVTFALAFKGVGHALTTTGQLHKTAMQKLTQPAKDFVNEILDIRKASRDLQLTAQKGLFPGVVRGLRELKPLMPVFKQAIWDTSRAMGYLAERMGEMVSKRGKILARFFATNTRTIQRMGTATEDFGAGFLEVFDAATPLINHLTRGIEKFAATFKDKTKEWRKGGQLKAFFDELRESYDNWTSTLGTAGKLLFNIWEAIQPVVHETERAIKSATEKASEWVETHKGSIKDFVEDSMKPMGAFLRMTGRLAEAWVKFSKAGNEDAARFFDGLRTQVIPLLEDWFLILDEKLLPKVSELVGALLKFLHDATPGFTGLISVFGHLAGGLTQLLKGLDLLVQFGNQFGAIGSVIATTFSVAALVVGWKGLRTEMSLAFLLLRKFLGFAPHDTPVGKRDLIKNLPYVPQGRAIYGAFQGGQGVGNVARRTRDRAEFITERGRGIRMAGGGPLRQGMRRAWNDDNPIQDAWHVFGPPSRRNPQGYWPPELDPWHPRTTVRPSAMERPQLPMYTGARFIGGPPPASGAYQDRQGRWRNPAGRYTSPPPQPIGVAQIRDRARDPSLSVLARPNVLKGGEAAAMFKQYEQQMEKSTKTGFLKGMKGAKPPKGGGGQVGAAAGGVLSSLTGGVFTLAMLLPLIEPMVKKAMGPPRTEIARKTDTLAKDQVLGHTTGGLRGGLAGGHLVGTKDFDRLKGFSAELERAVKEKNVHAMEKLSAGLKSVGEASKSARTQGKISLLTKDIDALAATETQKKIDAIGASFEKLDAPAADSINHILDRLSVFQNQIGNVTQGKGVAFKESMAKSFGDAAHEIQVAMDAGAISVKSGMKAMDKLVTKEYQTLGFSKEQAKNMAKTGDISGKNVTSPGYHGNYAVGGYFLGNKGEKGRDSIPMNVNGEKVVAARGEYVGIFNGQQQEAFDKMAAQTGHGSMEGFFEGNKRPHHMAKGGVVGKAGLIKLGHSLERRGFDVGENPAFGGVHPVHVKNSLHYTGDALDINADNMKGGEKQNLDRLSAQLVSKGWHVLWQVPGHFDHLHVDDAGGGGSVGDIAPQLPTIKMPSGGGDLSNIVGANLAVYRGVQQALLQGAADSATGLGDTGNYQTGKGGILSRSQIAGLMRAHGFPDDQIATGVAVALAESGGNTNIANSIGATGLWQILLSAHPEISGAEARDPNKATAYAHKLWKAHGWQPWEAYTGADGRGSDGPYLKYLQQPFGGNRAAAGAVTSVRPPKHTAPPKNDPVGEAPHDDPKKPKKKKKKPFTRAVTPPGGSPAGANLFKPKSKKPPKPKARKKIRDLIDKPFTDTDLNLDNMFDPITGESLDVTRAFLAFQGVEKFSKYIEKAQGRLGIMEGEAGLTSEEAIVNLYNSIPYADLTNYLKATGKDPTKWMAQYGDNLDVVNAAGMVIQGVPTRGVLQAVGEIDAQLAVNQSEKIPYGFGGGILGAMNMSKVFAQSVDTKRPRVERRKRLAKMKKAFEANVRLRKRYKKKMNAQKKKSYNWKDAITHNKGLITEWIRWKRDNVGETPDAKMKADHHIDELRDMNDKLRQKKPKGVDADGTYQANLQIYAQRGVENKLLVGDAQATTWSVTAAADKSQGAAGLNMFMLERWREADDFKRATLTDLKTSIPSEILNIHTLGASRQQWTGAHVQPPPIDTSQADADKDRLTELKKQAGIEALTAALLANTQFDVLRNFAHLLGSRYVGAFAHGGLVGETGMALVHKGETIRPDPAGPFRNGMNAPAAPAPVVMVDLHLRDKAGQLVELVDQRVRIVAPSAVSRSTGQRTRVIRAAPGGR